MEKTGLKMREIKKMVRAGETTGSKGTAEDEEKIDGMAI
jgi:hypothetical protein